MGVLQAATRRLASRRSRGGSKRGRELAYWRERRATHGPLELSNAHYAWCFTDCFDLPIELYDGKRVLDVGCGPRGSLEWAERAAERVGLDPLADEYRRLHSREHAMTYVAAAAESIPFPDSHFDVVATMNSLDHVDDLAKTIAELTRVTRPGGLALILTDVNHRPTPTEPQSFSWDVLDRFGRCWRVIDRRDYERHGDNMNDNLRAATQYDHSRGERRPGVLAARLERSPGR
jgi:ubiquinone/menaquinone biosynthesis C-methylase UbiE